MRVWSCYLRPNAVTWMQLAEYESMGQQLALTTKYYNVERRHYGYVRAIAVEVWMSDAWNVFEL